MYLSLHNVTEIVIDANACKARESYSRQLRIYTADGQTLDITLFADTTDALSVDVVEKVTVHHRSK